jgi:hypothetical protein
MGDPSKRTLEERVPARRGPGLRGAPGPFLFDTAQQAVLRTYASSKPSRGRW